MARSTPALSLMFDPMTSPVLRRCISSLASAVGPSLRVSRGGRTLAHFGPVLARASRSQLPGLVKARRTSATSGRNTSALLQPDVPPSLWENRLRQRLESLGSTECILTWKASVTPQGRPLSRLVPSMRPTDATDCGLWPTTRAAMTGDAHPNRHNDTNLNLETAVSKSLWPTATTQAGGTPEQFLERKRRSFGAKNPTLSDLNLNCQANYATWATPRALANENRTTKATPSQLAGKHGAYLAVQAIGTDQCSPLAPTEKPGALNPEFVSWLMGFPPEWVSCAPSVTRSSRKSRPKS